MQSDQTGTGGTGGKAYHALQVLWRYDSYMTAYSFVKQKWLS